MPRVRTAKTLAQRIDLQYFRRLHGFRRWRLILSIGLPLLAGGWLVGALIAGNQKVYSSGPLSSSHAVFGKNCALCHVRGANFSAKIEDKACLVCHNAPVHSARQTFVPACSSCHLEHQGKTKLAATADLACSQCHSDLKTKDGQPKIDPHLASFDSKHPQFLPLRAGQTDPGTIKLNHLVHMQPTVRGPSGPVQMQCEDCHRPTGVNDTWPYSVAVVQPASQQPTAVSATEAQQRKRRSVETSSGAYMTAIKYVNQCAACHVLQFDPLIPQPAPHDKPEVVRAFIIRKLTEYVAANPQVTRQPVNITAQEQQQLFEPSRNFLSSMRAEPAPSQTPTPSAPTQMATSANDWVTKRAADAERLLWSKNCSKCHAQTEEEGNRLPTFVKAVIPTRWFTRAEFDHQAHRMMTCISCHTKSPQSKLTSDINLPGIELCRRCHESAGEVKSAAEGRCYECHSYHDWRKEERIKGTLSLTTLLQKGH